VSPLKIRPGPDFDPNVRYEVSFYRDFDYKAGQLVLTPGAYPDIHNGPHSLGDAMSSVKFEQGVPAAPPVSPIRCPDNGELSALSMSNPMLD
jgi:hypothetical protein